MAIAHDNSQKTDSATASSVTLSNFVVGNNNNRILVVGVGCYIASPPQTVTSVTFGGSGLSQITGGELAYKTNYRISLWYMIAPAVSTGDIVANASASIAMAIGAVSLYNVHQTVPFGTVAQNNDDTASQPSTVNVSSATGELVIDFSLSEYAVDTHGTGQTENFLSNVGWGWTSSREDGAGTVTMSENLVNAGASWGIEGVPIKPSDVVPSVGLNFNTLRPAIFSPGIAR